MLVTDNKDQNQKELLTRTCIVIIISRSCSEKNRNNISIIDEHADKIDIVIHFHQNNCRKSCKRIICVIVSNNINNNAYQVIDQALLDRHIEC